MSSEKCQVCAKTVYPMERMAADNVVFHKGCMKCEHCQKVLTLGSYAALSGKYYCKPHFKQLFALKGNYSEGFGEEKHSSKWSPDTSAYVRGSDFTKPASSSSSPVVPKAEKPAKVEAEKPAKVEAEKPAKVEAEAEAKVEAEEETVVEEAAVAAVEEEKVEEAEAPVSSSVPEVNAEEECANAPSLAERMGAFKVSDSPVESPKVARSADSGSSSPSVSVKKETCHVCAKTVYPMERMAADNVVFHKGCMKCEHCQKALSVGNYAGLSGKYYCKPHFKQLFALKGNYSEGFGEEKHTAKWKKDSGEAHAPCAAASQTADDVAN